MTERFASATCLCLRADIWRRRRLGSVRVPREARYKAAETPRRTRVEPDGLVVQYDRRRCEERFHIALGRPFEPALRNNE